MFSRNGSLGQRFLTSTLLTFQSEEPFAVGGCPGPCGRLSERFLASVHWMLIAHSPFPSYDNPKCLQTLPNVPWGAMLPVVENHDWKGMYLFKSQSDCSRKRAVRGAGHFRRCSEGGFSSAHNKYCPVWGAGGCFSASWALRMSRGSSKDTEKGKAGFCGQSWFPSVHVVIDLESVAKENWEHTQPQEWGKSN